MRLKRKLASVMALIAGAVAGAGALTLSAPAFAEMAKPWETGMQPAATPVADRIHDFHNLLLVIIIAITLFVLALLVYVMVRFNARANPTPSRTSHNTVIEVLWTVIPIVILVTIAIPSFKLLYYENEVSPTAMTLKVTGNQWYWSYEYPDNGDISFDSLIVPDAQLKPGQPRLLTVNNPVVVPVNTTVRVLVTGSDVIHSWAVPAFGIKADGVPGRENMTWFRVERPGTYYGQCSELCGINHGFMPIEVKAVSKEEFQKWVASHKSAAADGGKANMKLARRDVPAARGN